MGEEASHPLPKTFLLFCGFCTAEFLQPRAPLLSASAKCHLLIFWEPHFQLDHWGLWDNCSLHSQHFLTQNSLALSTTWECF